LRLAQQRGEWFETRPDDLIDAAAAQEALAALPEEQRETIVLRLWAQLTFEEIRDITGLPLSTLFSRFKTGLSRLKQMMENSCQSKKTN
jgi:RNA polymerase sigma-70 factor (ECF subfamily)